MIVSRAPLRISFAGGGTDFPDFYRRYPGRVISSAIDKYVFIAINRTPLIDQVSARYSTTETVAHPSQLQHTRIRAALLDLGIERNIEIGSFASLPAKTGLGSSSAFSVALLAGLYACLRRSVDAGRLAEAASRLEIRLVGEALGKQDQYAAAFGGLHVYQFNPDDSVDVREVALTPALRRKLEYHILVFFTGLTRSATTVLVDQRERIDHCFDVLRRMSDSVPVFENLLLGGDIRTLGEMLDEGWQAKKSLSDRISTGPIDALHQAAMRAGAWGGKVLGAGGGGCLMFLAPPENHDAIRRALGVEAARLGLEDFREIPVSLVLSGAEVVFSGGYER